MPRTRGRAVFQKTDVAAEADIKSLIARAVAEFGRLAALSVQI
jgi:NAD(P)-dependent dehydrogenase (short-subunit alcohol dehydrogenase family)